MRDLFPRSTELALAHPLLRERWYPLQARLRVETGLVLLVWEVYRSDQRQGWLYGAGRTADQLKAKGLDPGWARPGEPIVTKAWSAATSAHGHTEAGKPAACALDVVAVGADGKPWSADDPWDEFVRWTTGPDSVGATAGLVHFQAPGKQVWDKPHLQLAEWSDARHQLVLPAAA